MDKTAKTRPALPPRQLARELALMVLGTALVAAGTYFFKFPNHFSTGGVTGLAVLINAALPALPASNVAAVLNLLSLVLGFAVLGRGFGVRTIFCTVLFSAMLAGLEAAVPLSAPLTDQPLLELLFGVLLPALGSAVLFNIEASTGGTDIVAMALKKVTPLDIGMALLLSDVLIAGGTLFLYDIRTGLFSLLGLMLKSVLVDSAIESFNLRKAFFIITSQPEAVCSYITQTLGRGATLWQAQGAYTHEEHHVVLTVLSRSQAVVLRRHLRTVDPKAFLIVASSSEIFGKGFLKS